MIKKISVLLMSVIILGFLAPGLTNAQGDESFRIKLESVLYKFKNYRFSTISIYKLKDMKDIRKAIKAKEESEGGDVAAEDGKTAADCISKGDKGVLQFVEKEVVSGNSLLGIRRNMLNRGMPVPDDLECMVTYYESKTRVATKQLKTGYVVTTRIPKGQLVPNTIIALIVSTEDQEDIKKNIDMPMPTNVITNPELLAFDLNSKEYRAENMYELVMNAFRQNNVVNKTLEAQGIGTIVQWAPKKIGISRTLSSNENNITSKDIQSFMRISEAQPEDIKLKKNEVILSPDYFSWRQYDLEKAVNDDGTVDTLSTVTNQNLPKFGIELKYGIEDINVPSLFSERLTASALWENIKLGVILPTNGWASMSNSLFSVDRKLTYGGAGIAAALDFPIRVIPSSGIFHMSMGYVFGDAEQADYKTRNTVELPEFLYGKDNKDQYTYVDHMIRFNGQLHYTFGITIDEDYQLRFGIGGTLYSIEHWSFKTDTVPETGEPKVNFYKRNQETIGGISGKLEFMAKNTTTPYGATLQYFDESLYADAWLQIPVIANTLSFRLDAKGYFKAFNKNERAWENQSVFIPMARVIVLF